MQVAEFVRDRTSPAAAARSSFPSSLAAHCQATLTAPASSSANSQGATRLLADVQDPTLDADASLHTLALRAAGVQQPQNDAAVKAAFCSGALCSHAHAAADEETEQAERGQVPSTEGEPRSVQAELTARLMSSSRLRNAGGDPDSALLSLAACYTST